MSNLQVKNLTISTKSNVLFSNLSFNLTNGQIIGLYEPTGSGKSTLLNYIAGVMDTNQFFSQGQIIRDFNNVSYVFQEPNLLNQLSVLKNVMLPVEKIYGKDQAEAKALSMLKLVQLDSKCNQKASKLSGGEKQRVSIARAFIYPSDLLLLDEPFHSQDEQKKDLLIKLTKEIIQEENRMCILVSHNKADFEALGAQIVKLIK